LAWPLRVFDSFGLAVNLFEVIAEPEASGVGHPPGVARWVSKVRMVFVVFFERRLKSNLLDWKPIDRETLPWGAEEMLTWRMG